MTEAPKGSPCVTAVGLAANFFCKVAINSSFSVIWAENSASSCFLIAYFANTDTPTDTVSITKPDKTERAETNEEKENPTKTMNMFQRDATQLRIWQQQERQQTNNKTNKQRLDGQINVST